MSTIALLLYVPMCVGKSFRTSSDDLRFAAVQLVVLLVEALNCMLRAVDRRR